MQPYFLNLLKFSVLQYCFMRPIITIIAIICDATGKLCPEQYSVYFAEVYLDVSCISYLSMPATDPFPKAFDFVVFSVALYGLVGSLEGHASSEADLDLPPEQIVFYAVTRDQLKGKSPLAKFLTIKGIVSVLSHFGDDIGADQHARSASFITFYQGFVFDILQKYGLLLRVDVIDLTQQASTGRARSKGPSSG